MTPPFFQMIQDIGLGVQQLWVVKGPGFGRFRGKPAKEGHGHGGQQKNVIRQQQGLVHIMGDHENGFAKFGLEQQKQMLVPLPGDGVQGGQRLIQKDQVPVEHQGSDQGTPLAHAPGYLVRPVGFIPPKSQAQKQLSCPVPCCCHVPSPGSDR
jgi:hypothetical protein